MFESQEKLRKMRETVRDELKHIPRGPIDQNLFRAVYQSARMNSMGKKAETPNSKEAVLRDCLEYYKKRYPNFDPQYDKDFFFGKKR
jgi:hypothetical protein